MYSCGELPLHGEMATIKRERTSELRAGEVTLRRAPRRIREHGTESESTMDVISMAERSDTMAFKQRMMNNMKLDNTFKMEPDLRFVSNEAEKVAEGVLRERLEHVTYDPVVCKQLSQELAAIIMERVKALHFQRYKMIAVVSIGSLKERPGLQFGSRCLWNQNTDSFASVRFTNRSLFAVAMVYGLYYE